MQQRKRHRWLTKLNWALCDAMRCISGQFDIYLYRCSSRHFRFDFVSFPSRASNAHFPWADRSLGVPSSLCSTLLHILNLTICFCCFRRFFPVQSIGFSFIWSRARVCVYHMYVWSARLSVHSIAIEPCERTEGKKLTVGMYCSHRWPAEEIEGKKNTHE